MSDQEEQPEEKKEPTATQLFGRYMRVREKVQGMTATLGDEITKMEALGNQLAVRFGIYVSGAETVLRTTAPPAPVKEEKEPGKFKPPAQMRSEAPVLGGKGSQEVAEIRREAGLDVPAEDSEALGAEGIGMMDALQSGMRGKPSVVAQPGEHQGSPVPQPSNQEGGPVKQGPVSEGE